MKEYLHLFTPIEDGLPNNEGSYAVITSTGNFLISPFKDGEFTIKSKTIDFHVTHWLDLSKLTTKERAIKLAMEVLSDCVEGIDDDDISYLRNGAENTL